jgi:hypothetical protein
MNGIQRILHFTPPQAGLRNRPGFGHVLPTCNLVHEIEKYNKSRYLRRFLENFLTSDSTRAKSQARGFVGLASGRRRPQISSGPVDVTEPGTDGSLPAGAGIWTRRPDEPAAIVVVAAAAATLPTTERTMTDPDQGENRRPAIAGLAIAVVLLVVGLWLAHELTASSKMQDCLMSGRTNCNTIETPQ